MKYLHTMIRTSNLEKTLDFFCNKLGLIEVRKTENLNGRFTLVFLCAPGDMPDYKNSITPPLIEITYNWPDENGKKEFRGYELGHRLCICFKFRLEPYAPYNLTDFIKKGVIKSI